MFVQGKPPNGRFDAFIGVLGFILALASFIASWMSGSFDSPSLNAVLVGAAIAGAFVFGYYVRSARDYVIGRSTRMLDMAVSKAVDARMAEVEAMVDARAAQIEASIAEKAGDAVDSRMADDGEVRRALGQGA